jgi:hypothetical protein
LIYLRIIDKKILSFVLQRPLLFDYIKARDKYLVANTLDRIGGLQAEFTTTWQQYFITPLESQEKIDWDIKSPPIALKFNVNENLLKDEFGDSFTDSITVYDFLGVIDTDTFNKIPNEELKDEISKLIKKTLEIAKENQAIGKEDPNKVIEIQEPISVVPITTAEEIFKAGVDAKKSKSKKTQEEIFKEIDEVDPEDLLSLLNEI